MIEKIPRVVFMTISMIISSICSFGQHTVTIHSTPTVNMTSYLILRQGQSYVQPSVVSDEPAPGSYTYSWSGPGGFVSIQKNPVMSTLGTYTLSVTNSGSCITQKQLLVRTLLPTDTAFSSTISAVCAGTGPILLDQYTSRFGQGTFSGTHVVGRSFDPSLPGVHKVYWTLGSVTDSTTITVLAAPSVSFAMDTVTTCVGVSTWLSALGTADTYNWALLSNPSVSLSNQANYQITMPTTPTEYVFTASMVYPQLTCSMKDTLPVIPVPVVAEFTDSIDHNKVLFYGVPGASSYEWNFGDYNPDLISNTSSTSTEQNPEKLYQSNGYFNVTLTIATMCSQQKYKVTKRIFVPDIYYTDTGIDFGGDVNQPGSGSSGAKLSIYPNPVVDYVQIQGASNYVMIKIFDILGQIVEIKSLDNFEDYYYFNMSSYKPGTYIFSFFDTKGNVFSSRIIKK